MASLYQLTGEYLQLMEMMEDPEMDPQIILDTAEGIEGELHDKADAYAKIVRSLESDANGLKIEIDRLSSRRQTIENNIKRLKKALQESMEATGDIKFKTELFSFGIQGTKSVVMDEQYIENIPEQYLRYKEPEVNKAKIKEDIENGVDLSGIAHLEDSMSLRIR